MREPSGDARTTRAWALSDGAKEVFRLPVVRSKDRRLFRVVWFVPGAAPAGPGVREAAAGVDGVAHDRQRPHDAVDLHGWQGVRREALRRSLRDRRRPRRRVGSGRARAERGRTTNVPGPML